MLPIIDLGMLDLCCNCTYKMKYPTYSLSCYFQDSLSLILRLFIVLSAFGKTLEEKIM